MRRDSEDARAYRETFATPEDARAATALLADLNRMDSLFFSRRPEDHAELARSIASLDPAAFASLAQAMAAQAGEVPRRVMAVILRSEATKNLSLFRPAASEQNRKRDRSSLRTNRDEGSAVDIGVADEGKSRSLGLRPAPRKPGERQHRAGLRSG